MRFLAQLRHLHVALVCATWAAFVVLLPRLMLIALVLHFRVQALLSRAPNRGAAFGDAHWTSWSAMIASAAVPPAALLGAWVVSRILYRGAPP